MAGLRGNIAWLMGQTQTAKGTAATPNVLAAIRTPFSGGNIQPSRATDSLSETDSSRDRGVSYVVSSGVEGSPEFYGRDYIAGWWLKNALGAIASTGATNYTHTITPANALPYVTLWRNLGDTLWERFTDCKVSSLRFAADAGAPLAVTAGIQGLRATRLTADPTPSDPSNLLGQAASAAVYNFNNATVTLSGGQTALVRSFELTIDNNVTLQQTDDVVPYDLVEGTREISLSFDLIFETLDEYNKFHYGGAAGTSVASSIFTTNAVFSFDLGANNSIAFNLPSIAYTEFPVEPSAGGDPVVASVTSEAQRVSGSPIITATVKNQNSTYV